MKSMLNIPVVVFLCQLKLCQIASKAINVIWSKDKPQSLDVVPHYCSKMVKSCDTLAELKAAILEAGDKLVVIDFYAEWCPPCRIMGPEIEKLAQQEKNVVFLSVDIAVNEEATEHFYINCLPTFIFIKGRAMIDEVTGAKVEELKATINKHKY